MPNEAHYVKFLRGSIRAWENLQNTPSQINDDTLYFIYENSANTTEGKLYLGKKLISGTGSGIGSTINLTDIANVDIDGVTLSDCQILVYNETTDKWQNADLSDIISTAISTMVGATDQTDGAAGYVPKPLAGDQNKFLKGNGTWATVDIPTFNSNVFTTNQRHEITLVDFESAPIGTIPTKTAAGIQWAQSPSGSLHRQIISSLAELEALVNDPQSVINENVVYMVPIANADPNSNNKYDEYLIINGNIEYVGGFGTDLSNYVTNSVFNNRVGTLENLLNDQTDTQTGVVTPGLITKFAKVGDLNSLILSTGNTTLVQEVNTISNNVSALADRLRWHELSE